MDRRFLAIAAGVLIISPALAPGVQSQGGQSAAQPATKGALKPQIEIPKMTQDFGEIFERDKYEHTFVVRNRGKADLVIDDVRPG